MDSKCSGTNEQDKDYVLRSTVNSNGISIRKRVKLQEKALDELVLGDPPFVPKKLRSALTRRNCQSTQPSSSDSKRNQHRDFQGIEMLQNTTEEFNEVEEEVAEVLISISSYVTSSNSIKSNDQVMKKLEEKSETKAPSSSFPPLEAPKKQNTVEKQNTVDYTTQKTTKPELLLKSEESAKNLSKQTGGTHQYLLLNGCRISQPTQLDSCSVQKQEFGVNPVEHKLQTLKPKNGSLMHDVYGKAHSLQFALHSRDHEQTSMLSTSNTVSSPDAVLERPVIGSLDLNTLPEKLSLVSTDRKRPWHRCITHVYISHLVKDNQKKELKLPMLHDNQLKTKNEVFNMTSTAINGSRSDMIHPPGISLLNRNNPEEARNHMLHGYDPQKQESENLGKMLAPFSPNQGVPPFKFSPFPYPSQYQEQLANASNQQVQLQHLPHFLTSSQLQHQQLQQHQLFWQAHMAQFRQNGMHHSTSSSSAATLANNSQPSIFSFMPNFNPGLHQQFVPLPSPSLSSRLKQNQMISNAESYR